jgi:U6 snRNA-associated Sm-like protein LSm6
MQGGPKKKSPSDFFKVSIGRPVVVKLNSGVEYRGICTTTIFITFCKVLSFTLLPISSTIDYLFQGILAVVDGYMNIAMEQTEEYVNSQLKNKYGDAFIRGNNGMCRA